jgi:hypothetical protein
MMSAGNRIKIGKGKIKDTNPGCLHSKNAKTKSAKNHAIK